MVFATEHATFEEEGVAILPGFLSGAELTRAREDWKQIYESNNHFTRFPRTYFEDTTSRKLIVHRQIHSFIERYFGEQYILSHFALAEPQREQNFGPHVDYPEALCGPVLPAYPCSIAVFVILDDYRGEESGSYFYLPGTHKSQSRPGNPTLGAPIPNEARFVHAPAGSCLFAHGFVWHGSGKYSGPLRRAYYFEFVRNTFPFFAHKRFRYLCPSVYVDAPELFYKLTGIPYWTQSPSTSRSPILTCIADYVARLLSVRSFAGQQVPVLRVLAFVLRIQFSRFLKFALLNGFHYYSLRPVNDWTKTLAG